MEIEVFDNLEDAFESIRRSEARADALATDEQRAIGWGDYFAVIPELNGGIRAWGRVFGRDELEQEERNAGAPDEEIVWTMARMDAAFERGRRFAWSYSEIEPDGELGTVHVCKMRKITEEEFNAAKKGGWR